MRTRVTGTLLFLAAVVPTGNARADGWTGPSDVARSAHDLARDAAELRKAIKDVDEDSPLVAEAHSLASSAAALHDSVAKGASYGDAKKDFRKIETEYAHFVAGLKKAHDVHHERPVSEAAKKTKATFDRLQAHMSGRRPPEPGDQPGPRPTREDNR